MRRRLRNLQDVSIDIAERLDLPFETDSLATSLSFTQLVRPAPSPRIHLRLRDFPLQSNQLEDLTPDPRFIKNMSAHFRQNTTGNSVEVIQPSPRSFSTNRARDFVVQDTSGL
jgi:hypothetical protein